MGPSDRGGPARARMNERSGPPMNVAYLTAGAGGMYCGSCLRDNALAAALLAQGRRVTLVPLYTPIRTDRPDVSTDRVFFGGINVYLQERWPWFRHVPRVLHRLLDRPALLRWATRDVTGASQEYLGRQTVSILRAELGRQRRELDELIEWLAAEQPDLIHLPNAMFVGLARTIKKQLRAAVVCTLTGEDIFLDALSERWRDESIGLIRERGRDVDGFVAVTQYYADYAAKEFDIPADRMHLVPLGNPIEDAPPRAEPPSVPFTIGYLARICPEKGLHVLCDALTILRRKGHDCRVVAAGYLPPSEKQYLDDIRSSLDAERLGAYFEYVGELDRPEKTRFLDSLHAFSVPTVYREAKGLFVLEALSRGVPVVQPAHGSFPELIEATQGGLLCEPQNPSVLAEALARLIQDEPLRERLGCQGRRAVIESFNDRVMADRTWEVFERIVEQTNATS